MEVGSETGDVTNDKDPDRHCEQSAKTAALPAGCNAEIRTSLVR